MPTKKVYDKVRDTKTPEEEVKAYAPNGKELEIRDLVRERVKAMKEHGHKFKNKDIEKIWHEADTEYEPSDQDGKDRHEHFETREDESGNTTTRYVTTDADKTKNWKANSSEPTLLVKIHTAMSIIISRDPEAFFQALSKKYEATTKLAHSVWKTSWLMDSSKEQVRLFAFNLCKYGWSPGRTYPRIIRRNKEILTELDTEHPENNRYETKVITDFNGIHREALDPYKTWIDEMTVPNDPLSTNDWYFEKDYSYDSATLEFGHYANWKFVPRSAKQSPETEGEQEEDDKERKDVVTIGFYENKNKDKYGIYVPSADVLLYHSPLPNDDGLLSLWHTYWLLRDARTPYGIGLWEIIRSKKSTYDKWNNMSMDQLVLSIYKMFFYTGTSPAQGDGTIKVEPGVGHQNLGGKVDWLEVPGPGQEAWDGLDRLKKGMDDDTGIVNAVEGELGGKTLGQDLISRENSLKRVNLPLENIASALNQEAYISLSWLAQTLSTPEVKEFVDEEELRAYEQETGINRFEMVQNTDDDGLPLGITATFLPEIPLNLEQKEDQLVESKERRFFQLGDGEGQISPSQLHWKGIISVEPRSILVPSVEIEKQRKLEIFNLVVPLFAGKFGPTSPELFARAVSQVLKINDEDLEDWLPDAWIQYLETGDLPQAPQQLFMPPMGEDGKPMVPEGETMKGGQGMTPPTAQTVVPRGEISLPAGPEMGGGAKGVMGRMMQ